MSTAGARRRLRALFRLGGVVPVSAGLHTLLGGGKSFPPWRHADAMVESELRFYSAFYVAYGICMLRSADRAGRDPRTAHALAAPLFVAGLGRAAGWLAVGKPHPLQRTLLAIELAIPALVVLEHVRLRSAALKARPK
jgi:hypothetical protein